MKIKGIRELIDFISESGLNEVNIETEEFKIKVKRSADVQTQVVEKAPVSMATTNPLPEEIKTENNEPGGNDLDNHIEVKSPMIGTFYRSANPESDPFIQVGDSISKGQTVCIVEAMKLFNEIEAELTGTVIKVLVDDASPVEYDQPLFLIVPA